jgi:hypothetical protein
MNPHLLTRLAAVQASLMSHHAGGAGLPSPMIGGERERVINEYLREVLPPVYRFGRGAITDAGGNLSGQLEVVMEAPVAPSFPMPTPGECLYLAESVIAIIEVKSDLVKQWGEVAETVRKVKALRRDFRASSALLMESSGTSAPAFYLGSIIPCYAVGYAGHKTLDGLRDRLAATDEDSRPDGALVIESGCFAGLVGQASGPAGLFRFVTELMNHANALLGVAYPLLDRYAHHQSDTGH